MTEADMEKGADAQPLSAEILKIVKTFGLWKIIYYNCRRKPYKL